MKKEHGNISDSTSSPERTGAVPEPRRSYLGRRALLRGGALSLAGAVSAGLPAKVLADTGGPAQFQGVEMPYLPDMVPGMGIDAVTGRRLGVAVDPGEPVLDATGQQVAFNFQRVDTLEDVYAKLGLDVSMSAHYSFFSTQAKFDYTRQLKLSRQATHILAQITVSNPYITYPKARWTPEAWTLLSNPAYGPEAFRDQFGDGFVRGVQQGGEFYAIYSIFHEFLEIQEAAHASLLANFNGINWGVDVNPQVDKETKQALDLCVTNSLTYQRGGKREGVAPATNPQEIMDRIHQFSTKVDEAPVTYGVSVVTYRTLGQPNPVDVLVRQGVLKHLLTVRLTLEQDRDDVEEEQSHPEAFLRVPAPAVLDQWNTDLTEQINTVNEYAVQAASGNLGQVPKDYGLHLPMNPPYEPAVRPDRVVLFQDVDYQGKASYVREKGWYNQDSPEMDWRYRPNPDVPSSEAHLRSIKVPKNWRVRFYLDPYFIGDENEWGYLDVTHDQPTLGFWTDRARSMVVYGPDGNGVVTEPRVDQVVLFTGNGWNMLKGELYGKICRLNESANVDPSKKGYFDDLEHASIRVPTGMKAEVFERAGFAGASAVIFSDVPIIADRLGSLCRSMIVSRAS